MKPKKSYDMIVAGGAAEVNIQKLQNILENRDKVLIHFPDKWLTEDASTMQGRDEIHL